MLQHCNDQGVLNILQSSGQFAEVMPVTVYTARWGPVIHVNTDWDFRIDGSGLLRTPGGQAYAIVHQWDRIAKLHPQEMTLRPYKTDVAKRKVYHSNYWFTNKHNTWEGHGLTLPDCTVLGTISGTVLCRTGPKARHGGSYAVFCPTHTPVALISDELRQSVSGGAPSPNASAAVGAVRSEFYSCTSNQVQGARLVVALRCVALLCFALLLASRAPCAPHGTAPARGGAWPTVAVLYSLPQWSGQAAPRHGARPASRTHRAPEPRASFTLQRRGSCLAANAPRARTGATSRGRAWAKLPRIAPRKGCRRPRPARSWSASSAKTSCLRAKSHQYNNKCRSFRVVCF